MTDDLRAYLERNVAFGEPDECWPYTCKTARPTQQRFREHGGTLRLLVYFRDRGHDPSISKLFSTCNNDRCCNPAHMVPRLKGAFDPSVRFDAAIIEPMVELDGCWVWAPAAIKFNDGTRDVVPRRFAWERAHGKIRGKKKYLVSKCGNMRCVRPSHHKLSATAHGAIKPKRLTPEEIAEARLLYAGGYATQSELASRYGISQGAISELVNNKTHRGA